MKKRFTLLAFLLLASLAHAQHNVFKLNLSKLMTLKAEAAYERTFLKQFSFQVATTVQIPTSSVPFAGAATKTIFEESGFTDVRYSAYWITPEVRFYLNPLKGSPKGIYLSLFTRYSNRIFNMKFSDTLSDGTNFNGNARLSLNGIGGGIMLGHQWIIAKHVSIDVYILGFGYNGHKGKLRMESDNFTEAQYKEGADEFNADTEITDYPSWFSKPTAEADGKSMTVKTGFPFPMFRGGGFNIGIAF